MDNKEKDYKRIFEKNEINCQIMSDINCEDIAEEVVINSNNSFDFNGHKSDDNLIIESNENTVDLIDKNEDIIVVIKTEDIGEEVVNNFDFNDSKDDNNLIIESNESTVGLLDKLEENVINSLNNSLVVVKNEDNLMPNSSQTRHNQSMNSSINSRNSEEFVFGSNLLNSSQIENTNNPLITYEMIEHNKQMSEQMRDTKVPKHVHKKQKIVKQIKQKKKQKLESKSPKFALDKDKRQKSGQNSVENSSIDDTIEEIVQKHNRKLFICTFENCNKILMTKTSLRDHTNRHLGLKQFKCQESDCKKSFYTSQALKNHWQLIHSVIKPFKCHFKNCNKSYGRKEVLNNHIRIVHKR